MLSVFLGDIRNSSLRLVRFERLQHVVKVSVHGVPMSMCTNALEMLDHILANSILLNVLPHFAKPLSKAEAVLHFFILVSNRINKK